MNKSDKTGAKERFFIADSCNKRSNIKFGPWKAQ
jgi:hypothetical protein